MAELSGLLARLVELPAQWPAWGWHNAQSGASNATAQPDTTLRNRLTKRSLGPSVCSFISPGMMRVFVERHCLAHDETGLSA